MKEIPTLRQPFTHEEEPVANMSLTGNYILRWPWTLWLNATSKAHLQNVGNPSLTGMSHPLFYCKELTTCVFLSIPQVLSSRRLWHRSSAPATWPSEDLLCWARQPLCWRTLLSGALWLGGWHFFHSPAETRLELLMKLYWEFYSWCVSFLGLL